MSGWKIALVIGLFTILFSVFIYKTIKIDPTRKPRVWPLYQRILVIVACLGALAVAWLIVPESSWFSKFLLTVFPILYIYRALKGWAFKSKDNNQ
jgi:hypothetical protein